MRKVFSTIESFYECGDNILVFPSEVCAEMWRRALLTPARSSLAVARLVSWDRFKQQLPGVRRDRRPASRVSRLAFVYELINRSAGDPAYQILFNSRFPESAAASAGPLARLLPRVQLLLQGADELRPDLIREYRAIFDHYRGWLDRFSFFEAEWEPPPALENTVLPLRPVVVWPELIEDFEEYREWMERAGELVTLRDPGSLAPFRLFASYHEEIRQVFSDIEEDLDAGIPLHEIVMSVADLDQLRPWIELESYRRSIPVRFAGGLSVARSAGARWLMRFDELVASDFSVGALAAILLDRSVPWRSRGFLGQMIEFGYRSHAYSTMDWEEAFSLARRVPEETRIGAVRISASATDGFEERFRRVRNGVLAVVNAGSAAELSRAINAFVRANLEDPESDSWRAADGGVAERVFSIAQGEVAQLRRLESHGVPIVRPWAIYRDLLRERLYVPQGSSGAIAVYPYRVAAGIPAMRHYALNLSQNATRVRATRPLGPRTEELRHLSWYQRDRSAAFLRAYGAAGDRCALSCSVEGVGGAQVVASEVLSREDVDPEQYTTPPDDLRRREEHWWAHEAPPPERMYRSQYRGLLNAMDVALTDPGTDFQRQSLAPELLSSVELEPLHLSPTMVRVFSTCPFSYLLSTLLKVRRRDYGYRPENRLTLGDALHKVMEDVLTSPVKDDPRRVVARVFADPIVRIQIPRRAEAEITRWYEAIVRRLFEDEELAIHRAGKSEMKLAWHGAAIRMEGKADRVTGLDGGGPVTIIDYKLGSGSVPTQSQVAAGEELQIPLYGLMVGHEFGVSVDRIGYVILNEARVKWITARDGTAGQRDTAERVDELIDELPVRLEAIRARIAAGDFRCPEESDCSRCGMRSICRRCYVTRRYADES